MSKGKTAVPLDLPRPIMLGTSKVDKQTAIYEAIREAILKKLLLSGNKLPSTRTLSERWKVSRGTVEIAFDRLRLEGYITRKSGSGSVVSTVVPDTILKASKSNQNFNKKEKDTLLLNDELKVKASIAHGVPFTARIPDPSLLDMKAWKDCLSNAFTRLKPQELATGKTFGVTGLKKQIAEYLRMYRGISCNQNDVLITTGIRSATEMIARILFQAGDVAAVEDPGYLWARKILTDIGMSLEYIRVDDEGLNVEDLSKCKKVRLVYVTPAHQAPLGITMTANRRLELLDWAEKSNAFIIEDDYDSDFNYNSSPLPAIKSIDKLDRVIFCGSFNKSIFPDLRIGYCIIPQSLRKPINEHWEFSGRSAGAIEQFCMERFISEGHFSKHLRLSRHTYLSKRDLLISTLNQYGKDSIKITGQQAGFHFILWLPKGMDTDWFCDTAKQQNIHLQPVHEFCHHTHYASAVLIGYSALSEKKIIYAGKTLGKLLRTFSID